MKTVFFAINRHLNRAEILTGFRCWEEIQGAFAVGIMMADGNSANGIGRCKSLADFCRKANHGGTTVLMPEQNPFNLQIEHNNSRLDVASDVWRSWTGRRFINGQECQGQRFYFGTDQIAPAPLAAASQTEPICPNCGESQTNCDCDPVCPVTHKAW